MATMRLNVQVAKTILIQLGGNQFMAMTGSQVLLAENDALTLILKRNNLGAKYLRIKLNSMDLYDMEFYKINSKTLDKKVLKTHSGVYNDMLESIFEKETGLYTKL